MDEQIIADVRTWVDEVVVGLELCPFAARPRDEKRLRIAVSHATTEEALLDDLQQIEACVEQVVLVPVSTRFGRRVHVGAFPSGDILEGGPSRYGYYLTLTGSVIHASTGHRVEHRMIHPQMIFGLIDLIDAAGPELEPIAAHLRQTFEDGVSPVQPGT